MYRLQTRCLEQVIKVRVGLGTSLRGLSGTTEMIPRPVRPWELGDGKTVHYPQGRSEAEYLPPYEGKGHLPDQLVEYLAANEDVLIDEEWQVASDTYAELYVSLKGKLLDETNRFERQRLNALLDRASTKVLVTYPEQTHLDEIHAACMREIGPSKTAKLWTRRKKRFATFHEWCFANYSPKDFNTLPVSEMISLKKSFVQYVKGEKVAALCGDVREELDEDGDVIVRGAKKFFFHAHHNVRLPHPSVVQLLTNRLTESRNLHRVARILDAQSQGGMLGMLFARNGAGTQRISFTSPIRNALESIKFNLRDVPRPLPQNHHLPKKKKRKGRTTKYYNAASSLPPSQAKNAKNRVKYNLVLFSTQYAGEPVESTHIPHNVTGNGIANPVLQHKALTKLATVKRYTEARETGQIIKASELVTQSPAHPLTAFSPTEVRGYDRERHGFEELLARMDSFLVWFHHFHLHPPIHTLYPLLPTPNTPQEPNGRIVVFCDTCALLTSGKDPLNDLLADPECKFESEDSFAVVASEHKTYADHHGEGQLDDMKRIMSASGGYIGMRKVEPFEETLANLPPGNLRKKLRLEYLKTKLAGGRMRKVCKFTPFFLEPKKTQNTTQYNSRNYDRILKWGEINKLNAMPYTPEVEESDSKENLINGQSPATLSGKLNTRMVILKRKADSEYRSVDLGQKRASEPNRHEAEAFDQLDVLMGYSEGKLI